MQFDTIALANYERAIETTRLGAAGPGAIRRRLRASATILALVYLLGAVLPAWLEGDLYGAFTPSAAGFWRKVVTAVVVTTGVVLASSWFERLQRRIPVSVLVQRAAADARAFTQPGWWRKVVRTGVLLGLAIGVPVGLTMAMTLPAAELPSSGRLGLMGIFLAGTFAWTLPVAFLMRWLWLHSLTRDIDRAREQGDTSTV